MSRFVLLLAASLLFFAQSPAVASDAVAHPEKTVESFYAGYIALVDKEKSTYPFVAKSDVVTAGFKKWFAKTMRDPDTDSDCVLEAQETPITPYKATKTSVAGGKATVFITARYNKSETETLKVGLVLVNGAWKIDSVSAGK